VTSPRLYRASAAAVIFAARTAAAQVPAPPPVPPAPPPLLAQIKDDKQLAETLQAITQDPAIPVDDPATRPLAQALITEGVKQVQARAYDQALANFLEAYAKFPSPKILLDLAATLRDMGRLADAANTYQRYLTDPATGAGRIAEVKQMLRTLDEQLTILTVRVAPHGADLSIDGGPFVPVGASLLTRVRSGLHLIRIRKAAQEDELTINGFEGETKEVALALPATAAPSPATPDPAPVAPATPGVPVVVDARAPEQRSDAPKAPPEHVEAWLVTGTQYGTADATSRERTVRDRGDGHALAAIVPHYDLSERAEVAAGPEDEDVVEAGVLGVMRIDGKGRGFAGGAGLAIARGRYEFELMMLKSDELGGYLGVRYRLLTGSVRPYGAVGAPGFVFDHDEAQAGAMTTTTRRLAIGLRAAAGVELKINGHVSVQGDLGYEHFFFIDDHFEADVFVPTLGVIGRL
jgi:hypothetical protein